ncbi:MAG: DUF3572 domain-containing protein [Zavarzinia sp.]|nr:DUF3572 domain-containing protein [Zavarzinia sp.]
MTSDRAEAIALMALAHLASDDNLLHRFMAETGMDATDLQAIAGRPDMLGGILDFVLADESLVIDFAAAAGLRPEEPMRARMTLPGFTAGDRGGL